MTTVQGTVLDAGQNPVPFATVHIALVTSSTSTYSAAPTWAWTLTK